MAYKVELMQDHGCVRLTLEGPITRTELELALYETFATLERKSWNKILLDVMRIEGTLSMTELFVFVCLSGERRKIDLHIAVLARREQLRVIEIIQDVEKDRGIELRGFSDQDAAFTWLCRDQGISSESLTP